MAETVRISALGGAGDGIAETAAGPLFVPFGLPGDLVEVERQGAGQGEGDRARIVSLLEPGPDRIAPFCPVFGRCGGCTAQHMAPGLYDGWKRGRLVEALGRAGLTPSVEPLRDAGGEGRRRITLHGRLVEGRMRVGFMEARSHRLVEIDTCPVAEPGLRAAPAAAKALADLLAPLGKPLDIAVTATRAGIDLDLRGTGPLAEKRRQGLIAFAIRLDLARLSLHGELLVERRQPAIRMGRALVVPPPGAFLQATAAGETALADEVVAGAGKVKRVLDLFAGCGPFALRLAEQAEVHAVESDAAMLTALDRAARATPGLRRIKTEPRDLFRRPLLPPELDRYDAVILDPPRAGAEAQVRQLILSSCPRVIMVSCDPGTFSRDAAALVAAGYTLDRVAPIDQFRCSAHVEIVGVFRKDVRGKLRPSLRIRAVSKNL